MKLRRQAEASGRAIATAESPAAVEIRPCRGIKEFEACVRVERDVWKSADIDVVPLPLFVVAAETGGQVIGAFEGIDAGGPRLGLVGFTLAVAGWKNRKPFLHSHMTAVLDGYQNRGIGGGLKLFQREDALTRGIRLVEWTFDPLATKNAYFNLMRLGAIARRYLANAYGITTSPLHGSLPTDRLVAEWHLASPRVRATLAGKANRPFTRATRKAVRIEIPANIEEVRSGHPEQALEIQTRVREMFTHWFRKGYAATAVVPGTSGTQYILEPWGKA